MWWLIKQRVLHYKRRRVVEPSLHTNKLTWNMAWSFDSYSFYSVSPRTSFWCCCYRCYNGGITKGLEFDNNYVSRWPVVFNDWSIWKILHHADNNGNFSSSITLSSTISSNMLIKLASLPKVRLANLIASLPKNFL